MNWGSLSRSFRGVAIKRLSRHELDPGTSNGHEFQGAENLTGLLGTNEYRKRRTSYYFVSDDGAEPRVRVAVKAYSSWYHRLKKTRKPEWRLYYPTSVNIIQELCEPGDLLLLALCNDESLAIFLAPAGSVSEQVLLQAFGVTQAHYRQDGLVRWMNAEEAPALDFVQANVMEQLSLAFTEVDEGKEEGLLLAVTVQPDAGEIPAGDQQVSEIAARMLKRWPNGKLGTNREMIKLVVDVCDPFGETAADPALERWLEVAEASYRIWEKETARRFIGPLRFDSTLSDIDLVEQIGSRWMSFRQSRVSRAGKVMEGFLAILFRRAGIRFNSGSSAKTENGKLPEFLFPDSNSYRNPKFPVDKLRILGSKTSFKERWRQILSEGDRVPVKHGVTRDPLVTGRMFDQMHRSEFVVVMPQPIISRYSINPPNLISLADFIGEISALQVG